MLAHIDIPKLSLSHTHTPCDLMGFQHDKYSCHYFREYEGGPSIWSRLRAVIFSVKEAKAPHLLLQRV